ncbi:IclR family transcriptional regulator [Halorussus sp. MSC15.2]|uniref:IclR family transcriptional regulator n=1 Tax=Halorussus sp. MSC15.2 TaxID=2283638 RepID=UPI0013D7A39F|nr:IclR family transcriptional regulator [Halorussus sp. MSC15.2]NEU55550.1 IclR family transcriptional regulator [Halorussus sp. MSC15.2]
MANYPVGATGTTFEVVEALATLDGAGVTEVAERLDLSKGSAYNHLATLEELGYAVNRDGRYRLSLRFLDLGARIRDADGAYRVARSAVDQLAHSSGETASLVVEEAGEAVFVYRAGDDGTTHLREGSRVPLHASAAGKAILANGPPEADGERLGDDAEAPTDETITERNAFARELQTVRDQGLAFDRGELFADRRAVAAPIVTDDGRAVGAVAVSGPADRMSGKRLEEDMPGLVLSTANKVAVDRITD